MRYYARFRAMPTTSGDDLRALTTRYTSGSFRKPTTGPRGGKAYKTCYRSIYYAGGIFYRDSNKPIEPPDGGEISEWVHVFEPFTGTIRDRFPAQSREQGVPVARLQVVDGRPVMISIEDGDAIPIHPDEWPTIEAILRLDKTPRRSPKAA